MFSHEAFIKFEVSCFSNTDVHTIIPRYRQGIDVIFMEMCNFFFVPCDENVTAQSISFEAFDSHYKL